MPNLAELMANLSPDQRELLLAKLNQRHRDQASQPKRALPRQPRTSDSSGEPDRFPVSAAQESLWFLDRVQPGAASYHVAQAVRLTGSLDAAILERSLNEIVRRHEALRTVFVAPD